MNISLSKKILTLLILSVSLAGCPEENSDSQQKQANQKNHSESKVKDKKDEATTAGKPQVSSTQSGKSKPISESAGNAADQKSDELYEVPNRFPEKEWLNEEPEKKEEAEKTEDKKQEPPQ